MSSLTLRAPLSGDGTCTPLIVRLLRRGSVPRICTSLPSPSSRSSDTLGRRPTASATLVFGRLVMTSAGSTWTMLRGGPLLVERCGLAARPFGPYSQFLRYPGNLQHRVDAGHFSRRNSQRFRERRQAHVRHRDAHLAGFEVGDGEATFLIRDRCRTLRLHIDSGTGQRVVSGIRHDAGDRSAVLLGGDRCPCRCEKDRENGDPMCLLHCHAPASASKGAA